MFGLSENIILQIKSVFEKNEKIEKAVIYGSRASDNFRKGSDIDIVLYGEKLNFNDLLSIENQLDDLMLPYKIDLSLFHKIKNPNLTEQINKFGKVFFIKKI